MTDVKKVDLFINIDEKDLQAVGNYLDQEKITWEEIV